VVVIPSLCPILRLPFLDQIGSRRRRRLAAAGLEFPELATQLSTATLFSAWNAHPFLLISQLANTPRLINLEQISTTAKEFNLSKEKN
jgi:hypothetical protein